MYNLKDGKSWEDVKNSIEFIGSSEDGKIIDDYFSNYFEKIELPKVKLSFYNVGKIFITQGVEKQTWLIQKRDNKNDSGLSAWIGKGCIFETIKEFNEKASILFGFELTE